MTSNTYSTGSWLGIVRAGTVVVLEAHTDPAIVTRLWDYLGQAPAIHGVLNEVTESFGTGLTGMPHFAILVHGERLHVILRGDMSVVTTSAEGSDEVSGRDVSTWSERSLTLPEHLVLTLADPHASGPELQLPIHDAVVQLQSLRLAAGGVSVPAAGFDAGSASAAPLIPDAAPPVAAVPEAPELPAVADFAEPLAGEPAGEAAPEPGPAYPEGDAAAGAAVEHEEPAGVEEAEDAYASFAMAADAEWNAQLEPVGRAEKEAQELGLEPDLLSTIHSYEDVSEELAEELEEEEQQTPVAQPEPAEPLPAAEEAADNSFTVNYDYLFGATVAQSVEAAAVRLDEEGQPVEPVVPPLPPQPPVVGTPEVQEPAAPVEEAAPVVNDAADIMIDSVPWLAKEEAQAPAAPVADAAHQDPYDPDHDGQTIMRSDFRDEQGAAPAPAQDARPATGPLVLARMCPNGHANPPSRGQCSDCGSPINSEPREVARPRLGTMHISTGELVELDHSLIIGRQPSVSRVMGGAMPRLVQVKSGNGDISRSHVEVRLDGWDVLLVDLKATNGTVLIREGQAPRRLSQGEEAILLNGDIAELGDGVSLLFDGLL